MSSAALLANVERVSVGEATPQEARITIRELLDDGPEGFGLRVYTMLKAVTLKMLTARRRSELAEWIDVIRQASALMKRRGDENLGERLLTLSDLTTDWMRTAEAHPIKEVLERPHVQKILQTIQDLGGRARRSRVLTETKIGEANLSRILGSLETIGLIERDSRRERTISLTVEAEHYLRQAQETRPLVTEPSGYVRLTPQENVAAAAVAKVAAAAVAAGEMVWDVAGKAGERLKTAAQERASEAAGTFTAAVAGKSKARGRTGAVPPAPSRGPSLRTATVHFKVKDFNAWRTSYNVHEKDRVSAGITNGRVFRSADDQNDVVLLADVADVSKARAWLGSPEMKAAMEKSGVLGSPSIRFADADRSPDKARPNIAPRLGNR